MSTHVEIDVAVAQLGQAMGMELKLDENRACRLVFDEKLAVDIEAPEILESTLVMTCAFSKGVLPDNREAVYQLMLEANFFARGTSGGVLAYDEDRQELVLQSMLVINRADEHDILDVLERLLANAESWVETLATSHSTGLGKSRYADYGGSSNMLSV